MDSARIQSYKDPISLFMSYILNTQEPQTKKKTLQNINLHLCLLFDYEDTDICHTSMIKSIFLCRVTFRDNNNEGLYAK